MRIVALLSSLALVSCSSTIVVEPSPGRVIDLTHPLAAGIPVYTDGDQFEREPGAVFARDGYEASRFRMGEHCGTHVDAPAHFAEGRASVADLPADWLVGSIARIDVRAAVARDPDYQVGVEDLRAWEAQHGDLAEGDFVFVCTGWSERWSDLDRYRNPGPDGALHFPGVSVDASRYLVARGVRCIGIDTLSTDPGPSQDFAQHRQFLGAGGFHVENLARLEQLPARGAVAIVAPLPIAGGSGAPARVLALVPSEPEVRPH